MTDGATFGRDQLFRTGGLAVFDKPYGVLRLDPEAGIVERYNYGEWFDSPTEFDVLIDPDPGERAVPLTEAEAQALIASGTLVVIPPDGVESLRGKR